MARRAASSGVVWAMAVMAATMNMVGTSKHFMATSFGKMATDHSMAIA
jgi:hypothetical protein